MTDESLIPSERIERVRQYLQSAREALEEATRLLDEVTTVTRQFETYFDSEAPKSGADRGTIYAPRLRNAPTEPPPFRKLPKNLPRDLHVTEDAPHRATMPGPAGALREEVREEEDDEREP